MASTGVVGNKMSRFALISFQMRWWSCRDLSRCLWHTKSFLHDVIMFNFVPWRSQALQFFFLLVPLLQHKDLLWMFATGAMCLENFCVDTCPLLSLFLSYVHACAHARTHRETHMRWRIIQVGKNSQLNLLFWFVKFTYAYSRACIEGEGLKGEGINIYVHIPVYFVWR